MSRESWKSGSDAITVCTISPGMMNGCVALPPAVHAAEDATGVNWNPPLPESELLCDAAPADRRGATTALPAAEHATSTPTTPAAATCHCTLFIRASDRMWW